MKPTMVIENPRSQPIIFGLAGIMLLIIVFIVHPRIRSVWYGNKDAKATEFFITQARQGYIDPRTYWEFQEFFSNGLSYFPIGASTMRETHTIGLRNYSGALPLVKYSSDAMHSTQYIVFANQGVGGKLRNYLSLFPIFSIPKRAEDTLYDGDRLLIFLQDQQTVSLYFWDTIAAMKNTVGFFDFTPEEMEALKGAIWVSETTIRYKGSTKDLPSLLSYDELHQ